MRFRDPRKNRLRFALAANAGMTEQGELEKSDIYLVTAGRSGDTQDLIVSVAFRDGPMRELWAGEPFKQSASGYPVHDNRLSASPWQDFRQNRLVFRQPEP